MCRNIKCSETLQVSLKQLQQEIGGLSPLLAVTTTQPLATVIKIVCEIIH